MFLLYGSRYKNINAVSSNAQSGLEIQAMLQTSILAINF